MWRGKSRSNLLSRNECEAWTGAGSSDALAADDLNVLQSNHLATYAWARLDISSPSGMVSKMQT